MLWGYPQALVLPRVLTSLDVLLSRGYTVFLACDTGNMQAPLVALGYVKSNVTRRVIFI